MFYQLWKYCISFQRKWSVIRRKSLHWNRKIKVTLTVDLIVMPSLAMNENFQGLVFHKCYSTCMYNKLSSSIRIMLFAFLFRVFEQDFVPELLASPDNNGVNDLLYDDSTAVTHPLWGSNHETNEFFRKIHEKSNYKQQLKIF